MVINMKLKLLPLLFLFLLINTSTFAATYPQHLFDNPVYQLIYANHDTAIYVDLSSVITKLHADGDLVIAVNEVTASFLYDPVTSFENFKSIRSTKTIWYYKPFAVNQTFTTSTTIDNREIILPPYIGEEFAYYSFDFGSSWMPFNNTDHTGPMRRFSNSLINIINHLYK